MARPPSMERSVPGQACRIAIKECDMGRAIYNYTSPSALVVSEKSDSSPVLDEYARKGR